MDEMVMDEAGAVVDLLRRLGYGDAYIKDSWDGSSSDWWIQVLERRDHSVDPGIDRTLYVNLYRDVSAVDRVTYRVEVNDQSMVGIYASDEYDYLAEAVVKIDMIIGRAERRMEQLMDEQTREFTVAEFLDDARRAPAPYATEIRR